MQLTSVTAGSIGTNCYLLYNPDTLAAVVVDPGDDGTLAAARIRALGLRVQAILLTHGHFDHASDTGPILALGKAPIYLHPADRSLPTWLTHGLPDTLPLADGDVLSFAGAELRVLHTPGHTPGSVCFLCGELLLCGDTLFAGSCGRVDLPGGSMEQMAASLRRLARLEGDYQVLPGHGEPSTLALERRHNTELLCALRRGGPGD